MEVNFELGNHRQVGGGRPATGKSASHFPLDPTRVAARAALQISAGGKFHALPRAPLY